MAESRLARGERPEFPGAEEEATWLADTIWNESEELGKLMGAGKPLDGEELTDSELLLLLDDIAEVLPEEFWDQPQALEDLARLRLIATGREQSQILTLAKRQNELKKSVPDPSIAPGGLEWEAQAKRLKS